VCLFQEQRQSQVVQEQTRTLCRQTLQDDESRRLACPRDQ
jgi:hypothetical protein